MKTLCTMLVMSAGLVLAQAAEPTLAEINQELALTKARLELADARLALAAKEEALAKAAPSQPAWAQLERAFAPSPDLSAAVLELAKEQRLKTQARPVLEKIGQAKWDSSNGAQRQFVISRSRVPASASQLRLLSQAEVSVASEPPPPVLIEIGLAQKKADGTATPTDQTAAEEPGTPPVPDKEKTGDSVDKLYAGIKEDIFFRNAGISFSGGYGVIRQTGKDQAVGSLIARWNVRQAEATFWYNNRTAAAGADLGYKPVPYYGMNRDQFIGWYANARGHAADEKEGWLTAWGPFIGGTVAGEKIDSGSGEERPYLAGLSFGFGFSTEAASLFYVDVGTTISPKQGFKSNKLYVGFSGDAELLGRVWDRIRGKK